MGMTIELSRGFKEWYKQVEERHRQALGRKEVGRRKERCLHYSLGSWKCDPSYN